MELDDLLEVSIQVLPFELIWDARVVLVTARVRTIVQQVVMLERSMTSDGHVHNVHMECDNSDRRMLQTEFRCSSLHASVCSSFPKLLLSSARSLDDCTQPVALPAPRFGLLA